MGPEEFENSLSPYERAELVRGRREQAECASLGFVPLVCDGDGGYYDVLVGPERAKHQGDVPEPVEAQEEKSGEKQEEKADEKSEGKAEEKVEEKAEERSKEK